jgi:hypothetical protein
MMSIGFLAELMTAYMSKDQESYSVKETAGVRKDAGANNTTPRSPQAGG